VVTTDQHGVTRYNGHTHVDAREWALNNPGKGMPPKGVWRFCYIKK
jgi:hypothetical protein